MSASPEAVERAVDEACVRLEAARPRKGSPLSDYERFRIIRLWKGGTARKQIAWMVGRPESTIGQVIRAHFGKPSLSDRNARLVALWNAGRNRREIGEHLGMAATAVTSMVYVLRNRGVPLRKGRVKCALPK